MRNRLKQLARGKFEYDIPDIQFSEESLSIVAIEGEDYTGNFVLKSLNSVKIKGVCYSTNDRVECLTPQFDGEEVRIRYQLHSKGLIDQDVLKGEFVIVCNQLEYSLPFVVTISKNYMDSSVGVIKNLYDFAQLAKEHWEEAYQFFYHKTFSGIIKPNEIKEKMIYRGIVSAKPSHRNLEEFLVGIGKKERVTFSCNRNEFTFMDVSEVQKETLAIERHLWGYLDIEFEAEGDFIEIPKKRITSNDFIGNTYLLDFFIRPEHLHAGNNLGMIILKGTYKSVKIPVKIVSTPDAETLDRKRMNREAKECEIGILELYQAYRLKRLTTAIWAHETIQILDRLIELRSSNQMYRLMKAQALLINRQRQDCEWILEDFKRNHADRTSEEWAYYLYIMTLMEREPVYVDKMTAEIKLLFRENPDSTLIFWILSFLDENYYNNNSLKLKAIEYWMNKGCYSPYLYLEAYYLIWQDPYLLRKLDTFETRLLRWAIRKKAMNKDISAQIFQILAFEREFKPVYYDFLCAAYEADPRPENAGIIISYLIRTEQYDRRFHDWYALGIDLELRVTGLYEAYLLSMDERKITELPKMIQMYFRYESNVSYRKLAVLYNNIIAAKDADPETYHQYQRTMGKFAMEQVEAEHMDDNLAMLYGDMLDLGFVNGELAHALAHIVFTNKLVVFETGIVRAIIYQREFKEPQIVPIRENSAYIQLCSKDYVILFENEKGNRFAGCVSYQVQPLMNPNTYLDKCMELAPDELSYIIYRFRNKRNYLTFQKEDMLFFPYILFAQELSNEYLSEMVPEILRYHAIYGQNEAVRKFLDTVDLQHYDSISRKYLMDTFVENHMFERANEAVEEYGIDQLGNAYQAAFCERLLMELMEDDGEEDDRLLKYCERVFYDGKQTELILAYLSKFDTAPSGFMISLWKEASNYEIDTYDLEEKILTQLMYSGRLDESVECIFNHYYNSGGRELVVLAYLTYVSHEYFVQEKKLTDSQFALLEGRYESGYDLNDACRLALLKKLSEMPTITEEQYQMEDMLLSEYTDRNMNFAFYKKLDKRLVRKYHFYDKVFLEYRTSPHSHVILHYSMAETGDAFVTEDMTDVYDGIFVKSFIMFFGERIRYYMSEEKGSVVEVTESCEVLNNDVYGDESQSRYNLLNQLVISETLQEDANLIANMNQYYGFESVTKNAFHIL